MAALGSNSELIAVESLWLEKCRAAGWLSNQEFCRFRNNLQGYLSIRGRVVYVAVVKPQIDLAAYKCKHCRSLNEIGQLGQFLLAPKDCGNCGKGGPFELCLDKSQYSQTQTLTLQIDADPPETPKLLRIRLIANMVNTIQTGDHIVITGSLCAVVPDYVAYGKQVTFELELTAHTIEVLSSKKQAKEPPAGEAA